MSDEEKNLYGRIVHSLVGDSTAVIDVYSVLTAYRVTDPAVAHAIKKLLLPGQRGTKDRLTDLREARQALDRAIQDEEQGR